MRSADNLLMKNATGIAIAVVTLVIGGTGLLFYTQNEANLVARNWVMHTREVGEHIQALSHAIEDAEIGVRGFMLTGKEIYLETYKNAAINSTDPHSQINDLGSRYSIAEEISLLKKLTADNSTQQRNVEEMTHAVKELQDYQATAVETRKTKGVDATVWKTDTYVAKQLMDHVRRVTAAMVAEETRLLTLRIQADDSATRQSIILFFSTMGLIYVLMILGIWIYQRARARAAAELVRYTQQLERSEEELKQQQEELKASNEEIESSNEELEEQNAQIRQQSEELEKSKKLLEEKAKELELASKYKSEFLANMSHELRTPLNSLLILARSLASNEGGNLTDEQVEEARIIHNGGLELLGLINDILDLSKVEAGKLNIMAEDMPLDVIMKKLRQQFEPVAKEKNVTFQTETEGGLPSLLHTDGQRVEQILKNLLSNAFKFTEKGAVKLKISRPPRELALQRSSLNYENVIAFSVTDTGIGIEASKLKDIFEAFQQEDGSTDRHYGGTGLGLTIARKFAHLLGGEIHVASEKGKGSTFTLVLPAKLAIQEATEGKSGSAASSSERTELKIMPRSAVAEFISDDRKTIDAKDKVLLIIEDDPNFAATLVKVARKRGYKCLAAGDGKTGVLLAVEQPVTAIILDLKLPDIDGMQVLDQLKHDLRSRHIPVHIITGRDEDSNVTSLRKGAIGYLTKPVAQEGIEGAFTRIETLLQSDMKKVLVIEDDKKTQTAIQTLLKKKDIHLTLTDTGHAALEHALQTRFDCIILDLRLPDMTGFEWLESAEKQGADAGLPPVIVYTAKDLTEEENRRLNRYTGNIIVKGAKSPERLLDEVTLFLHSVESTLSKDQQDMIRMQHNPDKVLQGRTVLLTDDDLRNTFALSKLLKRHGMNVVIADNGQMALEKLKEDKSIEMVIMDIMMPIMDGYQAMREIRKQKAWQGLPILALTARAMPEEQEKCMAAGANDYLTKPVDVERLLTLLRVWLFKQEMAA